MPPGKTDMCESVVTAGKTTVAKELEACGWVWINQVRSAESGACVNVMPEGHIAALHLKPCMTPV